MSFVRRLRIRFAYRSDLACLKRLRGARTERLSGEGSNRGGSDTLCAICKAESSKIDSELLHLAL
jgi:hypothetical protein